MAERVVAVSLTAQVNNYIQGMENARKATDKAKGSAVDAAAAYEQQNQAMSTVGAGLAAAGAVAITATALAVRAAVDWQSAWAGVTKTVDGTPEQLAAVEQGLRDLTGVLPAAHAEIASVAEAAGQLGIETENVVAFTRTMVDLGETTNLSANDAATALARFTNIMGTSQGEVSNLGSALVGLGNNYATTEAEILEMAMRLAGAGKQIGMSEGEVLGLSTALSSVGIEAEAGGSAMSKVMIDIAASVEEGGERVEQFASVAGVSADEFSAKWKSAPGEALSLFVKGLSNAEAQGSSTLGVLADLGIEEVRMRDALLRSASAADMFAGAMDKGNEEFEANNALTEEAAKRYATVESQLAIMGNRVNDAAIEFGDVFLPALSATASMVGEVADAFADMPQGMQEAIAIAVALGGAVALAAGAFLLAVPKIAEFKAALAVLSTSSIPAVASAATGTTAAVGKMAGGLSAAARFLMGPWGLALAAGAIGVKVLADAMEGLQASSTEMENVVKTATSAESILTTAFQGIADGYDFWSDKSAIASKSISSNLGDIADVQENWFARFGKGTSGMGGLVQALDNVDDALVSLHSQNAPEAARAFQLLMDKTDGTDRQLFALLNSTDGYKDALMEQASALGINVTEMSDAERNQALLNIAIDNATPVAKSAADAYKETADQANALADEVLSLVDAMNQANGISQDAESANAQYQASLADVTAEVASQRAEYEEANGTLEGFVASLDRNTAAGSANRDMLAGLAGDAQAAAEAQLLVDQTTMNAEDAAQKYYDTLVSQRQAFIDAATAAGFNADEVNILADAVFALPTEKEIKIIAETATAGAAIQALKDQYNNTVVRLKVAIDRGASDAELGGMTGIGVPGAASGGLIPGAPSDRDNRIYALATGEFVTRARQVSIPENRAALEYMNAGGVIRGYANGGYVQPSYASSSGGVNVTVQQGQDIARLESAIRDLTSQRAVVVMDGRSVGEVLYASDRSIGGRR